MYRHRVLRTRSSLFDAKIGTRLETELWSSLLKGPNRTRVGGVLSQARARGFCVLQPPQEPAHPAPPAPTGHNNAPLEKLLKELQDKLGQARAASATSPGPAAGTHNNGQKFGSQVVG